MEAAEKKLDGTLAIRGLGAMPPSVVKKRGKEAKYY
jgi:hypothetical protein